LTQIKVDREKRLELIACGKAALFQVGKFRRLKPAVKSFLIRDPSALRWAIEWRPFRTLFGLRFAQLT
jgi:hypothetical protein